MKDDAVIDVHAHVFPRQALELTGTGIPWHGSLVERDPATGSPITLTGDKKQVYGSGLHYEGPEARIRGMDRIGVDVQVLSVLPPLYRYELDLDVALPAVQAINDDIADLCRTWPDRFLGLATLPLQDPKAAVAELDRCMNELGLIGASIGTYVRDANLDDPALMPVFEALAERKAFVFVHPSHPRGGKVMSSYFLHNLIGNTWETAVAMASLMFGGPLERLPELTVCFAHGGGYGPWSVGRFEHGFEVRNEPKAKVSTPPRELLHRIYVDSLVHDHRALQYLLDQVGEANVLMGSDFPADMGPDDPVAEITANPLLSEAQKRAVQSGNTIALLRRLGHIA